MKVNLSTEDKIRLITGQGMWHTNSLGGRLESIHLADGPHGLRSQEEGERHNNVAQVSTCYPTASASACSWDRNLIAGMAAAIAEDAIERGVSVVLGPGINIKRSPAGGRNFEYFSEDPELAGELATAYVRAVQEKGVGTSLKHFAANSQETHRMTMNSMIDERALREIYLRAFEKCVKEAQPATVMAAYNMLNGASCCENRKLLTEILRDEWGFEGAVISDWGACVNLPGCIEAGMDLEMPDSLGNHAMAVRRALSTGRLGMDSLNRATGKILSLITKYPVQPSATGSGDHHKLAECHAQSSAIGSGDRHKLAECHAQSPATGSDDHHKLASEIAAESAVLLKNDGVLPLKQGATIIVVGALAENTRIQGGGSSHIATGRIPNVLEELERKGFNVEYAQGYSDVTVKPSRKLEKEAVKLVSTYPEDTLVLFCGGLTDYTEGEGYDRTDYHMPYNQERLWNRLRDINSNMILLSFSGSPYDMRIADDARAVLQMYLGGEGVAEAAAELLAGDRNPSGKLAETWPFRLEDAPCYENFGYRAENIDDVEYRESLYVGYRYYDTCGVPVRFPFGFGLSYTSFKYSDMKVQKLEDGSYEVSCKVTNTGQTAGSEIVELYVRNPKQGFMRAAKELRGFDKIYLEAGESGEVKMILAGRAFEIYNNGWRRVAGEYGICLGASVMDIRLEESVVIEGETGFEGLAASDYSATAEEFRELYGMAMSDFTHVQAGQYSMKNSIRQLAGTSRRAKVFYHAARAAARLMTIQKPKEDPEVRMMVESVCDGNIDSVVNQSGGIIPASLARGIVKRANRKDIKR